MNWTTLVEAADLASALGDPAVGAAVFALPEPRVGLAALADDLQRHREGRPVLAVAREATGLDEKGNPIRGRGDTPNEHDILTGSRVDGTGFPGQPFPDMTCGNWTKSGKEGSAMTGHHDKAGPVAYGWGVSWNSSHPTVGCDPDSVRSTGGMTLTSRGRFRLACASWLDHSRSVRMSL